MHDGSGIVSSEVDKRGGKGDDGGASKQWFTWCMPTSEHSPTLPHATNTTFRPTGSTIDFTTSMQATHQNITVWLQVMSTINVDSSTATVNTTTGRQYVGPTTINGSTCTAPIPTRTTDSKTYDVQQQREQTVTFPWSMTLPWMGDQDPISISPHLRAMWDAVPIESRLIIIYNGS